MGICKISRYSRRGSTLSKAKNCVCFYLESIESNYDDSDDSGYDSDDSGYDNDDSSDDNNDDDNDDEM
jgi:hypothetical protein